MSQAIITRYHDPTNSRGSRISATCWRGRVVVPYDHALSGDDNHRQAARVLCRKLDAEDAEKYGVSRSGRWITLAEGDMPDGKGMAHVIARRPDACVCHTES